MSKKSRQKKYVPKPVVVPISKVQVENFKEWMTRVGLMIEVTLPRGECTRQDLDSLCVFFNGLSHVVGTFRWMSSEDRQLATEVHSRALQSLVALLERSKGKEHYVATGDQLNGIREGYAFFSGPLKDALEEIPSRVIHSFLTMQQYYARS